MRTADQYIDQVLALLPSATPMRDQIATELRGHIAERLAGGHTVGEVLALLGDPVHLAESYLASVPLVSARFWPRVLAKVVDIATIGAVVLPLAWLATRLVPPEFTPIVVIWVTLAGGSLLFAPYTALTEWKYGQTFGKYLIGLRVVRESGTRIGFGQAVVRQLPMFFQFYWIDVLFVLFTEKSQRAFEMLSKTRVVTVQ
jgi:uncharacterized RDD family membrane protein YckC